MDDIKEITTSRNTMFIVKMMEQPMPQEIIVLDN